MYDVFISCIKQRFDQPDYKIFGNLHNIFLNAITEEPLGNNLLANVQILQTVYPQSFAKTQLALFPHATTAPECNKKLITVAAYILFLYSLYHYQKILHPPISSVKDRFLTLKSVTLYLSSVRTDSNLTC